MDTTPVSLLKRIQKSNDDDDWRRFVRLATPLLHVWAARLRLQTADANDLVQEVLLVLVEKLPEFSYDREKSFRGWMRTIATNKWLQWRRRRQPAPLDDADENAGLAGDDPAEAFWQQEFNEHLVARALEVMQTNFEPTTWRACWEHVVSGRSAREVAEELGITPGAVYVAKSRVLRRLRDELAGLID